MTKKETIEILNDNLKLLKGAEKADDIGEFVKTFRYIVSFIQKDGLLQSGIRRLEKTKAAHYRPFQLSLRKLHKKLTTLRNDLIEKLSCDQRIFQALDSSLLCCPLSPNFTLKDVYDPFFKVHENFGNYLSAYTVFFKYFYKVKKEKWLEEYMRLKTEVSYDITLETVDIFSIKEVFDADRRLRDITAEQKTEKWYDWDNILKFYKWTEKGLHNPESISFMAQGEGLYMSITQICLYLKQYAFQLPDDKECPLTNENAVSTVDDDRDEQQISKSEKAKLDSHEPLPVIDKTTRGKLIYSDIIQVRKTAMIGALRELEPHLSDEDCKKHELIKKYAGPPNFNDDKYPTRKPPSLEIEHRCRAVAWVLRKQEPTLSFEALKNHPMMRKYGLCRDLREYEMVEKYGFCEDLKEYETVKKNGFCKDPGEYERMKEEGFCRDRCTGRDTFKNWMRRESTSLC